jgi:hypothetical protein
LVLASRSDLDQRHANWSADTAAEYAVIKARYPNRSEKLNETRYSRERRFAGSLWVAADTVVIQPTPIVTYGIPEQLPSNLALKKLPTLARILAVWLLEVLGGPVNSLPAQRAVDTVL